MRFFFHVLGNGRTFPDDVGEELTSVEAAQEHAAQIAHELRLDDYEGCEVCAVDGAGTQVARITIARPKS
jgi:hypothetical protein